MAAAADFTGLAAERLLSLFAIPTGGRDVKADSSVSHHNVQQGNTPVVKQPIDGVSLVSQIAVGYKVIPINVLSGQALAEPQVLAGAAALALHGLLMKLHAQNMQQEQLAGHRPAKGFTSQQQSAAPGQGGAETSSQPAAVVGSTAQQLAHLDQLPAKISKLIPQEVSERGHAVVLQQLKEYMHSQQQAATHGQLEHVHTQHAASATVAAAEDLDGSLQAGQSVSGCSSPSCTDPLVASPSHIQRQRSRKSRPRPIADDSLHNHVWGDELGVHAPAGQVNKRRRQQSRRGLEYMASCIEEQLQQQQDTFKYATAGIPDLSGYVKQEQYPAGSDKVAPDQSRLSATAQVAAATAAGKAHGAAPNSLKRKHAGGGLVYRGVRLRPWGTYGAEIRDPQSGTRVWLGSFTTAEEAAYTYDAAVRELRGAKGVCNLPEPPEPARSKYQAKVRALLNRAQQKLPAEQQEALQAAQGLAQLQEQDDFADDEPGLDELAEAALSTQQQYLQEQYQQPGYWSPEQPVQPEPAQPEPSQHHVQVAEGSVPEDLEQRQRLPQQYQQPDFWKQGNKATRHTGANSPAHVDPVNPSQQPQPHDSGALGGKENQQEPAGDKPSTARDTVPTILPAAGGHVGDFGEAAAKLEEELRQLQSMMQAG